MFLSSKWQFNVSGLYQLPLNFNVAANLFGRQGYLLPYYASVSAAATWAPRSARARSSSATATTTA